MIEFTNVFRVLFLLIILSISCVSLSRAQEMTFIGGGKVSINNKTIHKPREILSVISQKANTGSLGAFKAYRAHRAISNIFAFTGGFIIGYSVAESVINRNIDIGPAVVGAGVLVISKIFDGASNSALKRVVSIYNTGKPSSVYVEPVLEINHNVASVGLRFKL